MIRLVCKMHTNVSNLEELHSTVNAGLLFLSKGKGQKSVTSAWFKETIRPYLNTALALVSVAQEGGNVHTPSGDQYHVSEYSFGSGFRKLVEYSKVYLNLNGRYIAEPILVSQLKPDAETGILTPSEVDAFNAFLSSVDGLNFSATKIDVMGTHLLSEVNVITQGKELIQVGPHSSLDDTLFAILANFKCGVNLSKYSVDVYDQASDVQLVQWLFGFSGLSRAVGGNNNVEQN